MKKVMLLVTILSWILIILPGCSSSAEDTAEKAAKALIEELYTVNSEKVSKFNDLMKEQNNQSFIETMQSNDKTLRSLMTEDEYNKLVSNRQNIAIVQGCFVSDCTMQVTDIALSKNTYDTKENKAGFNFEAKLKLISNKDNAEKPDLATGYIGLSKENGQWKVFAYKHNTSPKFLKEELGNR